MHLLLAASSPLQFNDDLDRGSGDGQGDLVPAELLDAAGKGDFVARWVKLVSSQSGQLTQAPDGEQGEPIHDSAQQLSRVPVSSADARMVKSTLSRIAEVEGSATNRGSDKGGGGSDRGSQQSSAAGDLDEAANMEGEDGASASIAMTDNSMAGGAGEACGCSLKQIIG